MAADPEDWKLPKRAQPKAAAYAYDLDQATDAVLSLSATVSEEAFTASALGTDRMGSAVLIRDTGVALTIGYLITEADEVTLRAANGQVVQGHVLGVDAASGLGLLQALEPLDVPALTLGTSQGLSLGDQVLVAAGGRRGRAIEARLQAVQEFAGYWEYLLDRALFTAPAHPVWSGAAVLNAGGELVGLGSLQLEQREDDGRVTPFNMSVPVELLAPIFDDLVSGRPTGASRPWLGLLAQQIGGLIVVVGTSERGPASRAELRQGDVILAIDGEQVSDLPTFYRRLWSLGPPGAAVPLTLGRGSDVFDVEVRSADRRSLLRKRRLH